MQKTCFEKKVTMSSKDYFSKENYEYLCEKSIEDIPLLYAHIKSTFCPEIEKYFNMGEHRLIKSDFGPVLPDLGGIKTPSL